VTTLLLSASDVRRLLDREALLRALRDAFAQYSMRKAIPALRAGSPLPGPGGRTVMIVFPGIIDGIPAFTVKVNTKIPGATRSVVGSGDMPALIGAASSFADRVGPYQKVAVFTFDGSPHINQVVGFGGNVRAGVTALERYKPKDPSTNLNGGIVEAVKVLSRQLDSAAQPLRFGTLVVFTDGTDRAHRVSNEDVRKTLDTAAFDTFAIGVGAEIDAGELRAIGRSGTFASQNRADIARGFDEVAARIEAASRRFYLLSYCSPSRAGEHDVQVEAVAEGKSGRLSHHFDATGFGPRCDPNQRPAFDVRHPRFRVEGEPAAASSSTTIGKSR